MIDPSDLCSACAKAETCAKEISFERGGQEFPGCPYGGCPWRALEKAEARVKKLEESLHYCNGTADLALKHRDEAEATNVRLAVRVGELEGALKTVAPHFYGEYHYDHPDCRIVRQALDRLDGREADDAE